jgi:agmatinase
MLPIKASLVVLAVLGLALAQQVPLKHATAHGNEELETMFAADRQMNTFATAGWSKDKWNGLVTFGHAPPARCWGADRDVPLDVAVVGAVFPCPRYHCSLTSSSHAGAPFDTGTGFRPGYVPPASSHSVIPPYGMSRARFGPNGIRQGSRRILVGAVNVPWKTVVTNGSDVVDCGDVRKSSVRFSCWLQPNWMTQQWL